VNEIPIVAIAKRLHRLSAARWMPPRPTFMGPGSWYVDEATEQGYRRVILTYGPSAEWIRDATDDATPALEDMWLHASISRPETMPSYDDLVLLHKSVWPDGWSYQVFAPPAEHVNIHPFALHLWGRLNGTAALPNFGALGSI
jgi:hypothetical protein